MLLVLSKLSVRRLVGNCKLYCDLSSSCVMEEQLATGWGFNQLWLEPLGGDFELVNARSVSPRWFRVDEWFPVPYLA